jgi:hypothetical protein
VVEAARTSMGQDISPIDMINIETFARRVVSLAADTELPSLVVIYLNRLSDLLFMLARVANRRAGAGEVTW